MPQSPSAASKHIVMLFKHFSLILVCISTIIHRVSSEYSVQMAASSSITPCIDSQDERFFWKMTIEDGKKKALGKRCKWLKRQKERKMTRLCSKDKTKHKKTAEEICPLTCKTCDNFPTLSPTAAKSQSNTPSTWWSEQSSAPSKSHHPSLRLPDTPSISPYPTIEPSSIPNKSHHLIQIPSDTPSKISYPTDEPSSAPSKSHHPSHIPSNVPSVSSYPTIEPSLTPSKSHHPSHMPSDAPSSSSYPTTEPSFAPSKSNRPSFHPSNVPSSSPYPTIERNLTPSMSDYLSFQPTEAPSISFEPPSSLAPSTTPIKKGLILGLRIQEASAKRFSGSISWFYNYKQDMYGDWQGKWADDNNIEFVPMIAHPWLFVPGTSVKLCYFEDFYNLTPVCTTQDVIDTLINSVAARTVRPRYLLGFNEQYNDRPPKGRDISPVQAAHYWGKYVQPGAITAGLELVSPSSNRGKRPIKWLADFLKSCYDKRDDEANHCDIELITKIAIHNYDCRESYWGEAYGGENSLFYKLMGEELGTYSGKMDWMDYLLARPLWVTETNCYWEQFYEGVPHGDNKKQCLRISGQLPDTHGTGSLSKIESMDNFERYAWWTTWNKQPKPSYLTYYDGGLTPVGKAYLNPSDPSVDCEYTGKKVMADSAQLTGVAWLGICPTTGTKMAQWIGVEGSTGKFTVEVPKAGNYAVNISYIAATGLDMNVRVNSGKEKTFNFPISGRWCFEGNTHPNGNGEPTVVAMELHGFKEGINTIHLSQGTSLQVPVIEWIAVVPKEGIA